MSAPSSSTQRVQRLLLTGAAGGLGKVLRERLRPYAAVLRLSDIADLAPAAGAHEEVVPCDLSDKQAVDALVAGCDAIVHLGGVSVERPFEEILEANIKGVFHIYEAARRHGVKRVVFASSNHVIGFYEQSQKLDANVRRRPDGYYGLSKSFGEDVAQFYFDRWGIETVSIRIGSSFPEPTNVRMMASWFSYDDLVEALRVSLFTPRVGHTIAFGTSDNDTSWWDNGKAAHLGFKPKDSSRVFATMFPATAERPLADDPATIYQGGPFVTAGPMY